MPRARFAEILRLLADHDVEFVVVGMTAGILHGAPVTTVDLDVVHRRSPENVARLLGALPGHQLLTTSHGDLDCLGTIDQDRGYEELLEQTVEMRLANGRTVRVLSLRALIEAKERSGRPKDLAVLPVLRATLDETQRCP